jgi:hypothetical protein
MSSNSDLPNAGKVHIAIYDFSILPYALGDVLTWNVKQCVKTKEAGLEKMDVYVCADEKSPVCFHQDKYISSENFQLHLFELLPAFYTNPFLRNIYIYHDRTEFGKALSSLCHNDENCARIITKYQNDLEQSHLHEAFERIGREEFMGHHDLNAHYASHQEIPKLVAPKGCLQDVQEVRSRIGGDRLLVLTHFRCRNRDQSLGTPEIHRDSNVNAWYEFIKGAQDDFPEVLFILLGKVQEKPIHLLNLNNVIIPRMLGYNLGHELAFFRVADSFMGSSSGFAAMANFTDIPYVITKMNDKACSNYGIKTGVSRLPFAGENQTLNYEEESLLMLQAQLRKLYHPSKGKSSKIVNDTFRDIETAAYYRISCQWLRDMTSYSWDKVQEARKLCEGGNPEGALSILNKIVQEDRFVMDNTPVFHFIRAMCFYQLKRYADAREAALQEIRNNPLSPILGHIKNFLKNMDILERQGAKS